MTSQGGNASSVYPLLTEIHDVLAVDVTPAAINTWTNVCALALSAGSWFVLGKAQYAWGGVAANGGFRLYDGTNELDLVEFSVNGNAGFPTGSLLHALTLITVTTIRLQVLTTVVGGRAVADHINIGSDGHNTRLHGIRTG